MFDSDARRHYSGPANRMGAVRMDPSSRDPDEEEALRRLSALEAKLAKARGTPEPPSGMRDLSQGDLAWRMVIEMVAGLLIGFGIGYGIDRFFGTLPIFLVIFTGLGLAAGIRVMLRSAREVEAKQAARAAAAQDGTGATDGD